MSIRRLRPTPYWLFILIWLASVAVIAISATISAAGLLYNLGLGVFAIITIASTIVYQGFMGVAFGIIFERTRNLIAPSIVHVVLNVFGSL